jgi:predicted RecB family nuclease
MVTALIEELAVLADLSAKAIDDVAVDPLGDQLQAEARQVTIQRPMVDIARTPVDPTSQSVK